MKWIKRNQLLILLFGIGGLFFGISVYLLQKQTSVDWTSDLARSFLSLAMTVVLGGFIKLIFDENAKRSSELEKRNEFRRQLLNRIRKAFDDVDSARLLIRAHKSAKTYGEQMRDKVIVSIPGLYDIKRTLADSTDLFSKETSDDLRLSLHYMIAYLGALTDEYTAEYLHISNAQFFQEALKDKAKHSFQASLPDDLSNLKATRFQELAEIEIPVFAWKKITELAKFHDFDSGSPTSLYYNVFIAHYEYSKSLLKGAEKIVSANRPSTFNSKYLKYLSSNSARPGIDLVALIKQDLDFSNERLAQ